MGEVELKELDLFLLARAMEHDSPSLLFRLACEYLRSAQLIRPGPVVLVERVAAAREAAKAETYERVERLLTRERCGELDRLLVVDPDVGHTRLFWLGDGATQASPAAVKAEVAKLAFLRGLDADTMDLSAVPAERRRFLAGIGRRSTAQALVRREAERRYPILLALLAETAVEVLDEVVGLFDQTLSGRESHARHRLDEQLAERARASEERIGLLDEMLAIAADPSIADLDVGGRLRAGIGMGRLQAAHAAKLPRLPRDYGHLELIEASFGYVREFAPLVVSTVRFAGGTDAGELVAAVGVPAPPRRPARRPRRRLGPRGLPRGPPRRRPGHRALGGDRHLHPQPRRPCAHPRRPRLRPRRRRRELAVRQPVFGTLPAFVKPGPAHTPAASDLDPDSGRARLSYARAEAIFKQASGGKTLHQLRHSSLTAWAENGVDGPMLMARSRHRSYRSLRRYLAPSDAALARLTAELDPAARRRTR